MSKRRQTIDQWVAMVIAEVVDQKPCSAIALLHLKGVGGATEEVVTKPIEGNVHIREMADHLLGRAEGFSQDLPGLQTFKLLAFYGTNEPHHPFHFTTSDGTLVSRTEATMSAHEPTPTGFLGQAMKHIEVLMHQNNQLVTANMTMANGVMSMCFGPEGLVTRSIRMQLEAVEVAKDAQLDMFEKRRALEMQQQEHAKELQTRKAIIEGIPHLVNRWTGREVFDEKANKAAIVDKLAFRFGPQDLDMLEQIGKISREEKLVLQATFAEIVEQKKKELEALKTVPTEEGLSSELANGQHGKESQS
jgi:hypothetical protein